jgi:hypothetical protein
MKKLDDNLKEIIMDATGRLTGFKRREYQAKITLDYFGGSARKAEREMGWGRDCVEKGLKENKTGIRCADNYQGRGRKRTEDTHGRHNISCGKGNSGRPCYEKFTHIYKVAQPVFAISPGRGQMNMPCRWIARPYPAHLLRRTDVIF